MSKIFIHITRSNFIRCDMAFICSSNPCIVVNMIHSGWTPFHPVRKLHFMYEVVRTSGKWHWSIYRTSCKCHWSIYRTSRKRRETLRVVHVLSTTYGVHPGVIVAATTEPMMTSLNGNISRVTMQRLLALCAGNSPVTGESPPPPPPPHTQRGPLVFFASKNDWANNRGASNLRRHRAHYDVTVMVIVTDHHDRRRQP